MVMWNHGEFPPEDPVYERFILRRITFPRPDSPIYTVDDLVEDIYPCFNVPENFKEESGHEMLEEMLWELCTERYP